MAWAVETITAANTAGISARADALVAADTSGGLQEFRALAGRAAAGTNVSAEKIRCFDETDAVLDARSFDIWQQKGDRAAGLREFEKRQQEWFPRRVAFESLWEGGEAFRYLALNAGGLGTQGPYGKFCLVTTRVADVRRPVAVFPGDSLQRYTSSTGVDVALVQREAAAWAVRGAVAAIERGTEALATGRADWPAVICRPGSYLEVVVGPPLPLADLDEVRLPSSYLDTLQKYERLDLARRRLTERQANELRAFRGLQRWRRTYGIAITPLP
ncbi:MAG: hypothetical protein QOE23_3442 [Pseudonocardiales bacterium]|nr:hypothetical protein [Pseudonocardiales bacterium]